MFLLPFYINHVRQPGVCMQKQSLWCFSDPRYNHWRTKSEFRLESPAPSSLLVHVTLFLINLFCSMGTGMSLAEVLLAGIKARLAQGSVAMEAGSLTASVEHCSRCMNLTRASDADPSNRCCRVDVRAPQRRHSDEERVTFHILC